MPEDLPTPGKYVDDELKSLFVEVMNQIISDLGRTVKLYFKPTSTECPNCFSGPDGRSNGKYDSSNPNAAGKLNRPFPQGGVCPVCKGSHQILTESSQTYTATIIKNPKDLDFEQEGTAPTNIIKTKMQLTAFEDIKRTVKALIDGQLYVLLRDPIKTGLKNLAFVKTYWKKMTD